MPIADQLKTINQEARTFGSGIFQKMWGIDYRTIKSQQDSAGAEKLLGIAMTYTGMPQGDLDGTVEQTQAILAKMSDSLAPDDAFWDGFAGTVQVAYPDGKGAHALGDKGGDETLKQQVHQFRYVISAQQAQWVRDNYKKDGMTDEEALAKYLAERDIKYSSDSESPRLHNKIKQNGENVIYPDGNTNQCNYKVLIGSGRHGEFIIDDQGNFVSELDTESRTENDVINGSSFNYADFSDNSSHGNLDVNTPKKWDPDFRKVQSNDYVSPNKANEREKGWQRSFKNSKGYYAKDGKSAKERTDEAARAFNEMVKGYEE